MESVDIDTSETNRRAIKPQQFQPQSRSKIRQQKLKITFIGYLVVSVFLALVQFIGVGFFTKGYLLSSKVLPNASKYTTNDFNTCMSPTKFDEAILLVTVA
ncbi:hypothetical protein G9P44_002110 [Scheffersomyces stipitis]|nr:hypothetical protein G9P44_002110 [Scheffersomyces stipitis]